MTLSRCGISTAVVVALMLVTVAPALAATHTWIGPPGGAWSNASNWSGGKPTSGEPGGTIVQFGSSTTSSMDIPGLVVDEIHFTGAGNTINGTTGLTVSGINLVVNIASEGADNTLGATVPLTLTGAAVEATSSEGKLTLAGAIGGSDGLLVGGSGGSVALTAGNTYTGPTTVISGALHIGTTVGYVIVGSALTIGNGVSGDAELVLDNSSDISPETPVTVNSDGVFNFNSGIDTAKSLTVNGGQVRGANLTMTGALALKEGVVTIAGLLSAGSLSMTGGTIGGLGQLALSGDIQATSAPSGPATIASPVQLKVSPTVTVSPGVVPELVVTGAIGETGGSRSITKAGIGTMLMSANNTYTGMTTVSAGTVVANGSQPAPFTVGEAGTLGGSGTVGATSVAGILAPAAPGLNTSALSFGVGGRLDATLTSLAAASIPAVIVNGTVAIDPSAVLNLTVAPGVALPQGSSAVLIDDKGLQPIGGQFKGIPNNFVLASVEGVPLAVSYIGGDGNDLSLTTGNAPPTGNPSSQAGPVAATPNLVAPAQLVAAAAGSPRVLTATSSGYGSDFALTAPPVCVRPGASFTVTLSVKKHTKSKAKDKALVKVTKVVFAIGAKTVMTVRSSPFRARLLLPHTVRSGAAIKVRAKAYLTIDGGKLRVKSMTVAVRAC